jgi:hypothetical protein
MPSLEDQLRDLDSLKGKGVITDDEYHARRAILLQQTSPIEKKGSVAGGIFKWGAVGCLAIVGAFVGLIVLIVVIIALAAGGSTTDLKDTRVALAVGSSGTVETAGDRTVKVTINAISDPAISTNEFEQPQAGNHYIALAVTIENVGQRESLGISKILLRGTDGFEYDNTFISGVGASDLNTYQNLTSGGKVDSVVAFEVKDGTEVDWVKFDPNPFAKGDLYFDK